MSIYMKDGEEIKFYGRQLPPKRGRIDKEEANSAFKKYKKEILDVFFAENGFYKWKSAAYVRLDATGLLQMVELQKSRFDSIAFCVNFSVQPLYVPHTQYLRGISERLGSGIQGWGDPWWVYADYEIAKESFENIRDGIKTYLLPWFDEFCAEETFRKMLMDDKDKEWPGYRNEEWRMALELGEEEKRRLFWKILRSGSCRKSLPVGCKYENQRIRI